MREYVEAHGGASPIHTILIANNGMAATKAMLSLREFAFDVLGDAKALTFVAMASGQDLDANAEFVRLADRVVEVPSGSNKNNYANVELISTSPNAKRWTPSGPAGATRRSTPSCPTA